MQRRLLAAHSIPLKLQLDRNSNDWTPHHLEPIIPCTVRHAESLALRIEAQGIHFQFLEIIAVVDAGQFDLHRDAFETLKRFAAEPCGLPRAEREASSRSLTYKGKLGRAQGIFLLLSETERDRHKYLDFFFTALTIRRRSARRCEEAT
jgi:hypothetical protein